MTHLQKIESRLRFLSKKAAEQVVYDNVKPSNENYPLIDWIDELRLTQAQYEAVKGGEK